MKLFITGGAGFIGSNLVRYALEKTDYSVINFDKLTYAGNLDSLADIAPRHEESGRYHFIRGDITDRTAVEQAIDQHQPDAILHLAAESHVDRSIDGPAEFIQTNVVGTYTLLDVARKFWLELPESSQQKFRFLHVSTDEVYGSLDFEDDAFSETTPYDPHSPYSATKAASDHLARAWHTTYGLPVLVTNCSNNYGPYQFPEKLIPVVILKALRGEPIPVYGQGANVRDWLHVEDHAAALLRVVEQGTPGRTYNIGGNNERSNLELVQSLCRLLDEIRPCERGGNYEEQITFVQDRPGHDLRYAINASRIDEELNWQPQHDHQSGFRQTVTWYLENEPWWQAILAGKEQLNRKGLTPSKSLSTSAGEAR